MRSTASPSSLRPPATLVACLAALALCGCSRTVLASIATEAGPDAAQLTDGSGIPDAREASCAPAMSHRPTAIACPTTRPVGLSAADAGALEAGAICTSDTQCSADAGANGRCEQLGALGEYDAGTACTYDTCFQDTDCPAGSLCSCDPILGNSCLPSNCRIDSDCACGSCSPTPGNTMGCFPSFGTGPPSGFYCHTPDDDCTDNSECGDTGFSVCGWEPTVGKWACLSTMCAG